MHNLLSLDKLKDKSFQELVVLMKNHFDQKPGEIVQKYKFDSRNLGRGWLEDIYLDWKEIKKTDAKLKKCTRLRQQKTHYSQCKTSTRMCSKKSWAP